MKATIYLLSNKIKHIDRWDLSILKRDVEARFRAGDNNGDPVDGVIGVSQSVDPITSVGAHTERKTHTIKFVEDFSNIYTREEGRVSPTHTPKQGQSKQGHLLTSDIPRQEHVSPADRQGHLKYSEKRNQEQLTTACVDNSRSLPDDVIEIIQPSSTNKTSRAESKSGAVIIASKPAVVTSHNERPRARKSLRRKKVTADHNKISSTHHHDAGSCHDSNKVPPEQKSKNSTTATQLRKCTIL